MPPPASADEGCRGPGAGCCAPTWEEAAPGNKAGKARSSGHLNGPRGTLLEQTLWPQPMAPALQSCGRVLFSSPRCVVRVTAATGHTQAPSSALTQREMPFPQENAAWFLGPQSSLCRGLSGHPMSSLHRNHPGVSPCSYLVVM